MPLTFPPPTAARDDLNGLLLLGGQPTVENLVAYGKQYKNAHQPCQQLADVFCRYICHIAKKGADLSADTLPNYRR